MPRHNLYMFRCENKLTKTKMATRTKVSRTTYAKIENGERDGSRAFWNNLQREFNVPDSEMWNLQKLEERTEQCGLKEK